MMEFDFALLHPNGCSSAAALGSHVGGYEAEEPLEPSAPALQLNFFRPLVIGDPNPEMIPVRLEPEPILSLLPPLTELRRQQGRSRLEQDAPLFLFFRDESDFFLRRRPARILEVLPQFQDFLWFQTSRTRTAP